jgi:WD40 repeat protein
VELWDVWAGQIRLTLTGHATPVAQAVWQPDGRGLATADEAGVVKVWDFRPSPALGRFSGTTFTPDGRHLEHTTDIGVWRTSRGSGRTERIAGPPGTPPADVKATANAPNGQFTVYILARPIDMKSERYAEVFSPNEHVHQFRAFEVELGRKDHAIGMTRNLARLPPVRYNVPAYRLGVSSDSRTVALGHEFEWLGAKENVRWFDAETGALTRSAEFSQITRSHPDFERVVNTPNYSTEARDVSVLGFHPCGVLALLRMSMSENRSNDVFCVWGFTTNRLRWRLPDLGWKYTASAFSPDGRRLATTTAP